ncbi:MAG: hypothetical protein K2X32_15300 [Phycisphaerales bacterium]|jgi:hypothetical protein|nr:hypothetical protein [Phycisphaerales bacterium]
MQREELERLRDKVLDRLRNDFRGVRREGGVSWSESYVIDDRGSREERYAARQSDPVVNWVDLVHDGNWEFHGTGGLGFLDPIGLRYYLPPAMYRLAAEVTAGDGQGMMGMGVCWVLRLAGHGDPKHDAWCQAKFVLFNSRQRRCVQDFLRLMAAREKSQMFDEFGWAEPLADWDEAWCAAGALTTD